METTTFDTPTATCGSCRATIKETLGGLTGISKADLDLRTRKTTVVFDPAVINRSSVSAALADAGYPPEGG